MPLPTGVPLIALGLFILMASNRRFSGFIRLLRRRVKWLDRLFRWVEDRTGGRFAATLLRTRPRVAPVPVSVPVRCVATADKAAPAETPRRADKS